MLNRFHDGQRVARKWVSGRGEKADQRKMKTKSNNASANVFQNVMTSQSQRDMAGASFFPTTRLVKW